MSIVTRFPPSPTGYLHIGGARTALFNFLLARKHGGRFILRIEDTDQARSTPEMTNAILEGMRWLGLTWDEGPYLQSERTAIYNEHVEKLLASGHAYYCDCSPEDVDAMRERARTAGLKPKYDGRCRERNLGPGPGRVVRFKTPQTGKIVFDDMVKGTIAWDVQELDDFIIRRADGSPIYQLAVVVDDALMGVTHVLRGDDHQSNTPKQILLYEALGYPLPRFGHVPMILGPDKKKLSKRHGAMSVMAYKEMGFLPEAMVNYLARLGWAHGDDEIFSLEELLEKFSVEGLGRSPSVFDIHKLTWVNSHYIKTSSPERLAPLVAELLTPILGCAPDEALVRQVVPLYQSRAKTLREMAEAAAFFFVPTVDLTYDAKAVATHLSPEARQHLEALRAALAKLPEFSVPALEAAVGAYLNAVGQPFKTIAQPLRVALTGGTVSPGLFETMAVLGKERVLERLQHAATLLPA